ncbi:GNAT family N-acetyltransferase [Dethiothermospora halolimnae]|uniref:GNAT family N-acetyltransferase n=1 Tax=Dethiothermospora halolimnae TaxID=3114390 RepID=UPI003CCC03D5
MKIEKLTNDKVIDFIDYCKRYRSELDDSFLCDEDLKEFKLNDENPTYILLNNNEIVGAVSLMINSYYKRGKKGRFRIFHSIKPKIENYQLMLKEILNHVDEINDIFLFIKEEKHNIADILQSLNFHIERYAFYLIRDDIDISKPSFPEGFKLREFRSGLDEEKLSEVINEGFGGIPKTPEMFKDIQDKEDSIDGGMMLLYHNDNPIGAVRASKEYEEGKIYTLISFLCVKPSYQNRGFGKNLLRAAINHGRDKGIPLAMLTVSEENDKAVNLYYKEGFEKKQVMVCYNYNLSD